MKYRVKTAVTRRLRIKARHHLSATRRLTADLVHFARLAGNGTRHIHVVRERADPFNWCFFDWLDQNYSRAARLFRHSTIGAPHAGSLRNTSLLIPWVQDPVLERNTATFRKMRALEVEHERAGIPVLNPVMSLSNSIKSRALAKLREAGLRAPRAVPIVRSHAFADIVQAVGLPFIVREDARHGGYTHRVDSLEGYGDVDWAKLAQPVAIEYMETRSTDGLYRKFRYLVMGNAGVMRHVVTARSWKVYAHDRIRDSRIQDEELQILHSRNQFHLELVAAREALDVDLVAIDYSIDREGRLVIWEPNPFPILWRSSYDNDPFYAYQKGWINHVFTLTLRFYLERASLALAT